jgi:hypothetical protein
MVHGLDNAHAAIQGLLKPSMARIRRPDFERAQGRLRESGVVESHRATTSVAVGMSDRTDMRTDLAASYGEERLPRYTSYPTAPHFSPAIGADTYARFLVRSVAAAFDAHLDPAKQLHSRAV